MRIDVIVVAFTSVSLIASIAVGFLTEFWVGLLVYAICVLELLVFLILMKNAWW